MIRIVLLTVLVLASQFAPAQTLNEGFDGTTFPPLGWAVYNADGGTRVWLRYTNRYYIAPGAAGIEAETDRDNDDWLVTRALNPAGADTLLKMFYRGQSAGHRESLEVWISTTDQQLSSFTTRVAALGLRSNKYESLYVSLGSHVGQAVYVGLRYVSTNKQHSLFLDGLSGIPYPMNDVGVWQILSPRLYEETSAVITPRVRVINYGTEIQSGFPVTIAIIDTLTGTVVFTDTTIAGTVRPDSILEITFPNSWVGVLGDYRVVARTHLAGDVLPANDSLVRRLRVMVPPIHDVGVTEIIRPAGGQYAGPIIPRVRVENFGSEHDTFPVTIQILSGGTPVHTDTIQNPPVNLAPYSTGEYDFPLVWNAVAGAYLVKSWTMLPTDLDPVNDTATAYIAISPPVHDVAAIKFVSPDTVYTDTGYTPRALVQNTGSYTETFDVTARIGTGYSSTVSIGPLNPGDYDTANFAAWNPAAPGLFAESCYTQLSTDVDRGNDTIFRTLTVLVAAPTVTVTSPNGGEVWQVGSNHDITWSHGGGAPDGDSIWYRTSDAGPWLFIAAVGPGTTSYAWDPVPNTPSESCLVRVKAFNATGSYEDLSDAHFTIIYQDVGATAILTPVGVIDSGAVVVPQAVVYNYGSRTETFPVTLRIGSVYDETITGVTLAPGQTDTVAFPDWTAQPLGRHEVLSFTYLADDQYRANDTVYGDSITVILPPRHDVGATMILAPVGQVDSGTVVTPRAIVHNFGTRAETFPVTFRVGSVYNQTVPGVSLQPGATDTVSFPTWVAQPVGSYQTIAFTALAGDEQPGNDTVMNELEVLYPERHDVGATMILAPVGQVDSGTVVTPRAIV
ncbi:MAG: choice-of-anchor J domain-containing protein, partial [bacterium]